MPKKNEMQQAWEAYWEVVQAYAQRRHDEVLKPWLKQKGYDLSTGMGTWGVWEPAGPGERDVLIDRGDLPKRVRRVLEEAVPGYDGGDLGSIMPQYDYLVDVANNGDE